MKLSRIDQIALNGATGEHYKYEEVADKIINSLSRFFGTVIIDAEYRHIITKILVENFPNDEP